MGPDQPEKSRKIALKPDQSHKPNSRTQDSIPDHIAHYRILQRLGKGGMGEVYLAEDTKQHNRKVALKILPEELVDEERRVRRFKQEARAALALNHPNILTIYEIGESTAGHYIATEFIEGETLRRYLSSHALTVDEVLGIAIQIAMALEAAHGADIVHRDIKPENIMLRADRFARDRFVKVLDFGLAKLIERAPPRSDPEALTIPISETSPGSVIGTSGYMSPEQAEGEEIDSRTDIFSLGIVIYEMIAGVPPFKGRTDSHTRVSILDQEPAPLVEHTEGVPRQLERIVSKALAKDRSKRYQTVTDLKLDLEQLRDELLISKSDVTLTEHRHEEVNSDTKAIPALETTRREHIATLVEPVSQPAAKTTSNRRRVAVYVGVAALAAVLLGAILYWRYLPTPINSVAILPFVNESNDPSADYLSDGITESITNSLSQLPGLTVMSRNAAFRFKNTKPDPQEAGRALNVGAVLSGRLVKLGEQVIIKTELIKVADGSQLWGAEYKSALSDILSVQDEVSQKISESLRVRLTGEDKERLAKRYSSDGEAYQLYLKGRYFWNKRNEEGFRNSIDFFKQAEERDPTFALAFSGLADSYSLLGDIGVLSPVEVMPKAKAAAQKAVDADPNLAEAYTSRAFVKLAHDWDWAGAESDFQHALKLNPKYPTAHQWYASYLMQMGKFSRAKAELEEAHQLDPLSPIISANTGLYSYYEHNYDDAIARYKVILQGDPDFWVARHYLGLAYVQKGMFNEAIAELRALIKAPPTGPLPDKVVDNETEASASLGFAYGMAGKRAEAESILSQLHSLSQRRYVSGIYFAVICAGLKDSDRAMEYLNKAFESRHPGLVLIRIEPMFDGLRSDQRFQQLVARFEPIPK